MIVFQARKITKYFGDNKVLNAVDLNIKAKERIGLIGVNGSGKTTLLKCLTNQLSADEGEIYVSDLLTIGYLEQLADPSPELTAWDQIMDSFSDLIEKRKRLRELERAMSAKGPSLDKLMDRYVRLTEEYERADGYACENTARRILVGLGFNYAAFEQNLAEFSGGEKTRLNLGRILAKAPDILFLDEPTNHLDMDSVEWLEDHLKSFSGSVLVVSHDRVFLERIATRIVELKNGQLISYQGGYLNYLRQKELNDKSLLRDYQRQQEHIQKTEEYIRRFKAGIKSKQAKGRESQLKRLNRIMKPVVEKDVGLWRFEPHHASGQDVLQMEGVSKSYGQELLLDSVGLTLQKGDKVALIGPNGSGKSTLLKIIAGLIEPDVGKIVRGKRVKIGYLSQEYEELNSGNTVIEEIISNFDIDIPKARNLLGRMLFQGDDVFKPVREISGGEKGRLSILKIFLTGANFMILDEPTNHLDIESRQMIEDVLASYAGTVLTVSHDRYFIDRVAKRVIAIKDKKLEYYWGNYSYYQEKLREKEEELKREITAPKRGRLSDDASRQEKERQKAKRNLEKQAEQLEEQIAGLEEKKKQLEINLSNPQIYHDGQKSRHYNREYQQVEQFLTDAYEEWVDINEQLQKYIAAKNY